MMLHGDIHPNPGPDSVSSENPNGISSINSQDILSSHLSIFHYNVQSLLPKLDLIRAESESYDRAVFSETWLKPNTTDAEIALQNFLPPFRADRRARPGGGVAIYVRDTLLRPLYYVSQFPTSWKDGNITALHKKDDRSMPSNYRPISLLCQAGKSLERCFHKVLYNYIHENRILTPFQSGFVTGDSTTFQLLHIYHTFCEAVDSGKEVRVVFCDISKAFDRV